MVDQGPPKGATPVAPSEPPRGATPASASPQTQQLPGKQLAPPAPQASTSPLGGGPSGASSTPSGVGLPTRDEDPAAFAFNAAAMLGEEPQITSAADAALVLNQRRMQALTAPINKKAPFVPVDQPEPDIAVRERVEQQYTPAYVEQKKAAGRWTAADELRRSETDALNASNELRNRTIALAQKVQQQGGISPEDEREISMIESERLIAKDAYERAVREYARDPSVAYKELMQSEADKRYRRGGPVTMAMEQFARPLGNSINSFFMNGLGGALRTLDAIGNIPNRMLEEDEYYSPFAQAADWITEGLDYVSRTEPSKTKDGIFDEEWNVNSDAALPAFIRTGVYMAGLVGASTMGGNAALGLTSFLTTEEDYYREAIEAGLSPSDAQQFSLSAAAATASLEGINPQNYSGIKGQMAKRALDAIKSGASKKEAIKQAVEFVGKEVAGENAQEFAQAGSDMLAKYLTNQSLGEDRLDASMTWQEAAETALLTTALSGLVAGVGRRSQRPLHKQAIEWATSNPEVMTEYILASVPSAQQQQVLDELDRRVKADRGVPSSVTGQSRRDVTDAAVEKQKIKEEQAQASIDETVAAAAGNMFDEQLAEQDKRIADALGIDLVDIARKQESDRLREQYDKAKLKSEITGEPMPEGMKKPPEVKLEPKTEPSSPQADTETQPRTGVPEATTDAASQTFTPESLTLPGREEDGSLAGLPRKVKIGDSEVRASSFEPAQRVAQDYMAAAEIPYNPPSTYVKADPERGKRIADEYDKMKHDPEDPDVKASYDALIRETMAQWDAMMKSGLTVEFMRPNPDGTFEDPYAGSPRLATEDVRNNNHLWVFPTTGGFGHSGSVDLESTVPTDPQSPEHASPTTSVSDFLDSADEARRVKKFGPVMGDLSRDALSNSRMFLSRDGKSGFAISPSGDLIGLHSSSSGRFNHLVQAAIAHGAKKIDTMDTGIVEMYKGMGFVEVGREPFDERYAPSDWTERGLGRPDHVYLELAQPSSLRSSSHPMLRDSGVEIGGEKAMVNDIFRAVHDYFGHVKEGVGFRADGEENAWRAHASMYSPEARRAMTTETRGQNSWVNFGPYGERNRGAKGDETVYADQKAGLMPEWVSEEGRTDEQSTTAPEVQPGLNRESLKEAFGYSDEVADATIAIADAMGLDKSKINVVKGGTPGVGSLQQSDGTQDDWRLREPSSKLTPKEREWYDWARQEAEDVLSDPSWLSDNPDALTPKGQIADMLYRLETQAESVAETDATGPALSARLRVLGSLVDKLRSEGYFNESSHVQGRELQQGVKGSVEFAEGGQAIIRALENPDPSTGIHELAHVARRFLFDRSIPQENRQGITDEHITAAENWSGAKDGNWSREAEEKFARGFERYLLDGNAPNSALRDVFQKFSEWLADIYNNLIGSPVQKSISPEMRRVYDALVTRSSSKSSQSESGSGKPKRKKVPEGRKERATAERLREQDPGIYGALTEEELSYEGLSNKAAMKKAADVIDRIGVDKSMIAVMDMNNDLPSAARVFMARMLAKELELAGRLSDAEHVAASMLEMVGDFGSGLQAMRSIYNSPELFTRPIILARYNRIIKEAREKRLERSKKAIKDLKKSLDDLAKEGAERAIKSAVVGSELVGAASPQKRADPRASIKKAFSGDKNKIVTKSRKDELVRSLRGRFNTGPDPAYVELAAFYVEAGARGFAAVAEQVAKELGRKAVPYMKDAYKAAFKYLRERGIDAGEPDSDKQIDEAIAHSNAQELVEQLNKALRTGDRARSAEILSTLQDQAKELDAWGAYRDYAVKKVKSATNKEIAEDRAGNDAMRDFTDGLVRAINEQAREQARDKGSEPKSQRPKKSDIEVIGDAFRNFEKYEEVWRAVKNEFEAKLRAANARMEKAETPAAKEEAAEAVASETARLEKLDRYFGDLMVSPFSKGAIGRAVKSGMKDLQIKLSDIVRQHYTEADRAKASLKDKLMADAGLDGAAAKKLADAVDAEFERIVGDRKRKLIDQYITRKGAPKKKRKARGIEDETLYLTNIGALSNKEFADWYADMKGWPSVNNEDVSELTRLADRVQRMPEGRPRNEAIQDLLTYEANLEGISLMEVMQGIFYANMLSSFETQLVNIGANSFRLASEWTVASLRGVAAGNPKDALSLASSIFNGLKIAYPEALSVLRTGYSPLRGKIDIPPGLERKKFKGMLYFANAYKYVRRFMVAMDTVAFEPLKELRAYQYAVADARGEVPSDQVRQRALDILNRNNESVEAAKSQAEREYNKEVAEISKQYEAGSTSFKRAMNKAKLDRKRREFELVELARDEEIREASSRFALRSTYNDRPKGTLGVVANAMTGAMRQLPALRYIAPFVNVIANVANDALDYYGVGAIRALRGGSTTLGDREAIKDNLTDREIADLRADAMTKTIMGISTIAALLLLTGDDDDEKEPFMEITGGGYGDWRANETLRNEGWQEYSFRIGDNWYSYKYTPLILAFGLVGHYRDAKKYRKDKIDDEFYTRWAVALGRNMTTFMDLTFLESPMRFLEAAFDGGEDVVEDLLKQVSKTAKRQVVPAFYDQIARSMESAMNAPKKDVSGFDPLGQMVQDVPLLRDFREDEIDALGDPVVPEVRIARRFWSPVDRSDRVWSLINEKSFPLRKPSAGSLVYYDAQKGKDVVMNRKERNLFYTTRGKYIRKAVESGYSKLSSLSKEEFASAMRAIQSDATSIAKARVAGFDTDPVD